MAKNTKNLFNNASSNTADFFSNVATDPNPGGTWEDGVWKPAESGGGIIGAAKKAAKNFTSYGNRMDKYNAYLNTLKRLDVGLQKMSGKVATGVRAPASAGQVGGIKSTRFSDKIDEWNSRMRKFAVARYYAELGKK